ncbi:MAG: glycine cleavage system aminomethyltransferase GcvT [Phycisphaeraceae bacterium]|nr:glycine cleavage system aminomethyltransferase GcvT [Phycisphaeraceae bacterium]
MLRTPLYDLHVELGAQLVEYAGWEMPIRYTSIVEEHLRVRQSGGIFDVSHMGRFRVKGKDSERLLERLCTRKIAGMQPGQCRYSLVCNEAGGVRDDVIVMRHDEKEHTVVVNAANREKLLSHFESVRAAGSLKADVTDQTADTAMIAIQGPAVMPFIARFSDEIPALKKYRFLVKNLMIAKVLVARTGYTGEDGVEIILPKMLTSFALKMLRDEVDLKDPSATVGPAGLGARDTLRLEAGMPLYGHELGEDISALSAGLDFAIALDKEEDFVGRAALRKEQHAGGPPRRLVGLNVEGRRTPRQDMPVLSDGKPVGSVTSGCMSPTLGRAIAMAYVDPACTGEGARIQIDAGRAVLDAAVTPLPFYKRSD